MLGGLQGKTALTAYVAIALLEAGDNAAANRAIRYLEGAIDGSDDPYAVAITAYALQLAQSPRAAAAVEQLLDLANESEDGLFWGNEGVVPVPGEPAGGLRPMPMPPINPSAAIETTGYATLALVEGGDRFNASRAAKWLVSRRNALGGFGSTQDTVVSLQALTSFAVEAKSDVDATVVLSAGDWRREVRITPANADVMQILDVPLADTLTVEATGKGQVVLQTVRRYNVPEATERHLSIFQLNVDYGADQIAVDDLITVNATIKFTPPEPLQAGMIVFDVAIPTGFAAETDTVDQAVQAQAKLKRYEIAGRKVIFYIEDMEPQEELRFSFKARALYPVKAQAVTSQAYSYYRPEWNGEVLGGAITVGTAR
jgi:CD109 antigen